VTQAMSPNGRVMFDDDRWRASTDFPGDSSVIGAARDFTAAFLAGLRQAGVPIERRQHDDAVLVISELVTNVVRHAPGPCRLTLELAGSDLEITVSDTSTRQPVPQPFQPQRIGQHGLEIVLALCASVESRPTAEGKAVHAVMPLV
jgi:anti-sigma regulatory factor (Ser/Thr protein kinase)